MRRLSEQAYAALEQRLVTLDLAPGTLVTERDLVDLTGIGRTPVREAVLRLADEGLLQVMPRKGLQVAPVSRRQMARVLELRRSVERLVVTAAARRADAVTRARLEALATALEEAHADLAVFYPLDRQLDELLERACDNPWAVRALAPLLAHCRRFWFLSRERLSLADAARRHGALARAVAAGDVAGAATASDGIIGALEPLLDRLDSLQ